GRGAGGADGGGAALARGWGARGSARMADPGGVATDDRPRSRRGGAASAGGGSGESGAGGGSDGAAGGGWGARRHADAAVDVLPSCPFDVVGDRADAAGGRRVDDGGDRARVSGAGGDDGAADQPREADCQGVGRAVRAADGGGCGRAAGGGDARAVSDLQRGVYGELGGGADAARSVGRGAAADAVAAPAGARPRRGRGAAGADAADGRAARGADGARGGVDSARRAGSQPMGCGGDRGGGGADLGDIAARRG